MTRAGMIEESVGAVGMAQLLADLAGAMKIEIPSKPAGAEMFGVRMIGAATMLMRRSEAVDLHQRSQVNLMGV